MVGQKNLKDISVHLASEKSTFANSEDILLHFIVTNHFEKKQKFCSYMTPLEGMYGDILSVTNKQNEQVEYIGIMKKRGKPTKENYIKLTPGDSSVMTFNLLESYPISEEGTYFIQFHGNEHMNGLPPSNILSIEVSKE